MNTARQEPRGRWLSDQEKAMTAKDNQAAGATVYEGAWHNRFLPERAEGIDDMIAAFRWALDELRAMKAAGVVLADVQGDCARLVTTDPAVAETFGFETAGS